MSTNLFSPEDREIIAAHIGEMDLTDDLLERFFASALDQASEKYEKALRGYRSVMSMRRAKDEPPPVPPVVPTPEEAVSDMMVNLRAALDVHTGDDGRARAFEDEMAKAIADAELINAAVDILDARYRKAAPAPEPHNFPANMSDKLVDWVEPASEDLQQLMAGEETLAAAVERMTPGLDELLDMASALSEPSFEQAIVTIPVEKRNTWTERLFDERARLRLKRNTDEENLDRENLISRVATVFTKVGSKR